MKSINAAANKTLISLAEKSKIQKLARL